MLEMIADAATTAASTPSTEAPTIVKLVTNWAFPLAILLVAMMFLQKNKGTKQDRERKDLLKQLKRGDRVQTIGGVIAKVVSADDNEVVLKVDEATNTKMTFSRAAIHRVLEPA